MKKIKILILIVLLLGITGCFKRDSLEDIDIITTNYAIEYVTEMLYGEHSTITSIYPDDTDTFNYILSNKEVNDYSKKDLLIYNGSTKDKEIAYEFLSTNKKMLIIDSSYGIDVTYKDAELWLNPSNLLMMSQNIRNGLKEYISNSYLEKEIDANYEDLKVLLSEIDAELKLTATNASKKTIVVNSDALKFLEKYGLTVISLDTTNSVVTNKTITEVNDLIKNKEVTNIILLDKEKNSAELEQILSSTGISTLTLERLDSITDSEREEKSNYVTIMANNIEILKKELYE